MQDIPLSLLDNLAVYQDALSQLAGKDKDSSLEALTLKHRAVLALARAGAADFAQSEYDRYGLGRVKNHEDIMALAGRLAKDRFEASGDVEQARSSANFYESAFQSTGGYYSGINAATMSLIAKVPAEIVMGRAQAVLTRLSNLSGQSDEDRYFIHASRAEAYYILGDKVAAAAALQAALDYDPLNYTAHASTYRQFRLLSAAHGETMDWLTPLRAPVSVHYAGHLFSDIADEDRLTVAISDLIQQQDIGFGYGALAAGSDIIFAECLLAEGGELHLILPVPQDVFKRASVEAFDTGEAKWSARFDACAAQARSVRYVSDVSAWPESALNNFAARIAMGEACARAHTLSSHAAQVLIWDKKLGKSLTAHHAVDWQKAAGAKADRAQFVLEFPGPRRAVGARLVQDISNSPFSLKIALAKNEESVSVFDTVAEAMAAAETALNMAGEGDSFGLHIAAQENHARALCESLSRDALPRSLLVSQDMAAIISLEHSSQWVTGFAGFSQSSGTETPAYFAKRKAE